MITSNFRGRRVVLVISTIVVVFLSCLAAPSAHAQRGRAYRPPPRMPRYEPPRMPPKSETYREYTSGYRESVEKESGRNVSTESERTERLHEPERYLEVRSHVVDFERPPGIESWQKFNREKIDEENPARLPSDVTQVSERPIDNPKFLVFLPEEGAYESTFDQPFTAKAKSEIESASTKFSGLSPGNVDVIREANEQSLMQKVMNSMAQPLVLVAHSTSSGGRRRIKLSDGSSVDVEDIQNAALTAGTTCIIITCHGKDLGVDRKISLTEAYNICHYAQEAYRSGNAKTIYDYIWYMRKEANSWKQSAITLTIVTSIGGVTTMVVCTFEVDNSSDNYFWYIVGGGATLGIGGFVIYRLRKSPSVTPSKIGN